MKTKAIIYDLDNTLYPVPAIGQKLFEPVFDAIEQSGDHAEDMDAIRKDMMKTPFRIVAQRYGFSQELTEECIVIQEDITYNDPIATFEDYSLTKDFPGERFLVTTGFFKMQNSKVENMGIRDDFKEVHIVDPTITSKKEVFAGIMHRYNYRPEEVLVVGDDLESEIKAAKDLGIDTVLYNPGGTQDQAAATYAVKNYTEMKGLFDDE